MSQKTIANVKQFLPTKTMVEAIDDNFTEVYAMSDAANAADISTNADAIAANGVLIAAVEDGTGFSLTEYADNAAAVSGGLAVGDLYTTSGTVKVVTA